MNLRCLSGTIRSLTALRYALSFPKAADAQRHLDVLLSGQKLPLAAR